MERSESIKNIAGALLVFDEAVSVVKKGETNPFFKNKYASLPEILSAIKEPLLKAGLTIKQFPVGDHELTTLLIHAESGEYIESTYKMNPAKNDPQGDGSRITYQRRYALGAVLGLNIDEDDDGNKASGNTDAKAKTEQKPKDVPVAEPAKKPIDAETLQRVINRAKAGEHGVYENMKKYYTLTPDQEAQYMAGINIII